MKNGTIELVSDRTLRINNPDGSFTSITFTDTSSTVEVYIKLAHAGIDFTPKETNHGN